MKYLLLLISFLYANELYINLLENNMVINYINKSIYKQKELNINPSTKQLIITPCNKFIIGNLEIDSLGNEKSSIGVEFDLNKNQKVLFISDNKKILDINKIFNKNKQIIQCYENKVLFNLKYFLLKAKQYDNYYSQFLPSLRFISPCLKKGQIIFFKLKKEKISNIKLKIKKKREIFSKISILLNQNNNDNYISASFNIKIPLKKEYSQEDLTKLQNYYNALNKIYLLILKINNNIDNFYETLKKNKSILENLKFITLIAKISPSNVNIDRLITIYKTYFSNLYKLNSIQRDIFINKFLLKIEKRKLSGY